MTLAIKIDNRIQERRRNRRSLLDPCPSDHPTTFHVLEGHLINPETQPSTAAAAAATPTPTSTPTSSRVPTNSSTPPAARQPTTWTLTWFVVVPSLRLNDSTE
ncbi:hypothetical protein BASA81_018011 [Batrachochytrium salamandrivorans]|nr:hypothetical protein BASA81_018011 [Batrachochytrium salamandrivorans]